MTMEEAYREIDKVVPEGTSFLLTKEMWRFSGGGTEVVFCLSCVDMSLSVNCTDLEDTVELFKEKCNER